MNHWAPVSRYPADGIGLFVADASTFTVGGVTERTFRCTVADTVTAAHVGDHAWFDAYGEITLANIPSATAAMRWGCWLRVADASNYYTLYCDGGGTFTVAKVVAGASTTLLTASYTLGTSVNLPGVFRAEALGDNLSGWWRGHFLGSVADTALTAPGAVSMTAQVDISGADVTFSRFEAGPLTASYAAPMALAQQAGPSLRHARLR